MKYLVIGLGNLGRAIAESLTRIGNEVIGVDINPHKTEAVKHTWSIGCIGFSKVNGFLN